MFDARSYIDRLRLTDDEKIDLYRVALEELPLAPKDELTFLQISDTLLEAAKIVAHGDELVGISTGYNRIDELTKGLTPGSLTIVFGETSHGKSQLVQNIAYRVAKDITPTLMVTMEMTATQTTARIMQIAGENIENLNIYYPEKKDLKSEDLDSLIRKAVDELGVGLVVIDQLHDFVMGGETADYEKIVGLIKRLAVVNQVPIILVSHVNAKSNSEKAPKTENLKGSSSIKQVADIILGVWRKPDEEDTMIVQIHKNRNRGFKPGDRRVLLVENNIQLIEQVKFDN